MCPQSTKPLSPERVWRQRLAKRGLELLAEQESEYKSEALAGETLYAELVASGEMRELRKVLEPSMFKRYFEEVIGSRRRNLMGNLRTAWRYRSSYSNPEANLAEALANAAELADLPGGLPYQDAQIADWLNDLWGTAIETNDGNIIFGDAAAPQLRDAAGLLRERAEALLVQAATYERIADALQPKEVVRDLGGRLLPLLKA